MISKDAPAPLKAARPTLWFLATVLLATLLLQAAAHAQVLVYRIEFTKNSGINYNIFNGGYFAAPVLGGSGSFLLTSSEDGLSFTQSDSSGNLFTAVNGGEKKAVISATTGTGTASGAFVALGDVDHTVSVNSPTVNLTVKVADKLTGMAVSADSDASSASPRC